MNSCGRRAVECPDRGLAQADPGVQRIAFGQRQADVGAEIVRVGQVVGDVGLAGVEFAMTEVVAEADAVVGQIRFEVRNAVGLQIRAALQGQADAIAGTEEIVLLQGDAGDQALHLRIADAEGEASGGLLLDRDGDVDLVFLARHARRVDRHGLEIAEALQADLGAIDGGLRIPGALELAHLAAQHLVLGMQVALERDPAHVHALARNDLEIERRLRAFRG